MKCIGSFGFVASLVAIVQLFGQSTITPQNMGAWIATLLGALLAVTGWGLAEILTELQKRKG